MYQELESLLMSVIRSTNHAKGHSDEERFHDAMKALFGNVYKKDPKIPKGYTFEDMENIALRIRHTENLEGSIKEYLKEKQEPIPKTKDDRQYELESEQEEKFEHDLMVIKQHFVRNKDFYRWLSCDFRVFDSIPEGDEEISQSFLDLIKKQQEQVAAYSKKQNKT